MGCRHPPRRTGREAPGPCGLAPRLVFLGLRWQRWDPSPKPWLPHLRSQTPHTPSPRPVLSRFSDMSLVHNERGCLFLSRSLKQPSVAGLHEDPFAGAALSERAKPGPGPSQLCWKNPGTVFLYVDGSQSVVPGPAVLAPPESALEMQIPGCLGRSISGPSDS